MDNSDGLLIELFSHLKQLASGTKTDAKNDSVEKDSGDFNSDQEFKRAKIFRDVLGIGVISEQEKARIWGETLQLGIYAPKGILGDLTPQQGQGKDGFFSSNNNKSEEDIDVDDKATKAKKGIIAKLGGSIGEFVGSIVGGIATGVSEGLTTLLAAIGKGLGGFLTGLSTGIAPLLTSIGAGLGGFLTGLSAGLAALANPMALIGLLAITTAIIGLGFALKLAAPGIEAFGKLIKDVITSISSFLKENTELILGYLDRVVAVFKMVFDTIKGIVESIGNTIQAIITATLNSIQGVIEAFVGIYKTVIESIANTLNTILGTLSEILNTFAQLISNTVGKILEVINSILKPVIEGLGSIVSNIGNTISGIVINISDIITGTINKLLDTISSVVSNIGNILNSIAATFIPVIEGIVNTVSKILNTISTIVKDFIDAIQGTISKVLDTIKGVVDSVGKNVKDIASTVFDGVKGVLESFANILTSVSDAFQNIGQLIVNVVTGVVDGLEGINRIDISQIALLGPALLSLAAGLTALTASDFVSSVVDGLKSLFGSDSYFEKIKSLSDSAVGIERLNAAFSKMREFKDLKILEDIDTDDIEDKVNDINKVLWNLIGTQDKFIKRLPELTKSFATITGENNLTGIANIERLQIALSKLSEIKDIKILSTFSIDDSFKNSTKNIDSVNASIWNLIATQDKFIKKSFEFKTAFNESKGMLQEKSKEIIAITSENEVNINRDILNSSLEQLKALNAIEINTREANRLLNNINLPTRSNVITQPQESQSRTRKFNRSEFDLENFYDIKEPKKY